MFICSSANWYVDKTRSSNSVAVALKYKRLIFPAYWIWGCLFKCAGWSINRLNELQTVETPQCNGATLWRCEGGTPFVVLWGVPAQDVGFTYQTLGSPFEPVGYSGWNTKPIWMSEPADALMWKYFRTILLFTRVFRKSKPPWAHTHTLHAKLTLPKLFSTQLCGLV